MQDDLSRVIFAGTCLLYVHTYILYAEPSLAFPTTSALKLARPDDGIMHELCMGGWIGDTYRPCHG